MRLPPAWWAMAHIRCIRGTAAMPESGVAAAAEPGKLPVNPPFRPLGDHHGPCDRTEPHGRRAGTLARDPRSAPAPDHAGGDQAPARLRARGRADRRGMVTGDRLAQ